MANGGDRPKLLIAFVPSQLRVHEDWILGDELNLSRLRALQAASQGGRERTDDEHLAHQAKLVDSALQDEADGRTRTGDPFFTRPLRRFGPVSSCGMKPLQTLNFW